MTALSALERARQAWEHNERRTHVQLRLVFSRCDFCGQERDPADLTPSDANPEKRHCRTDVVACVNRGTAKKEAAWQGFSVKVKDSA